MLLTETYENLNAIDRSLFDTIKNSIGKSITPKSKIEVDPIRPHTFKNLVENYLTNTNISFIIVRVHKRQWCMITSDTFLCQGGDFMIKFTKYGEQNSHNLYNNTGTSSTSKISQLLSKTIKKFYDEKEGVRPSWDCIVVYKDTNVKQLTQNRKDSVKGAIPLPNESGYDEYISDLREDLEKRLQVYIRKQMTNITTKPQLIKFLKQKISPTLIKVGDKVYRYESYREIYNGGPLDKVFRYTYVWESNTWHQNLSLKFDLKLEGMKVSVIKAYIYNNSESQHLPNR